MSSFKQTPDRGQAQWHRKHVFVVNSAPEFLNLIRELLQDEQYNVTTTNYVPQTFEQIAALQPDLLIVDLAIGEQGGWDLLKELNDGAELNNIPVIVTSTDQRYIAEVEAAPERFGQHHYLAKPFDIDAMVNLVKREIGSA